MKRYAGIRSLGFATALIAGSAFAAPLEGIKDGITTPAPSVQLTTKQRLMHGVARAALLTGRAVTAPAQVWPLNGVVAKIAHGEPFGGLSPKSATKLVKRVAHEDHAEAVVGRLAPSLVDIWSVRGAEKSFMNMVDALAAARAKDPQVRGRIAFDPDSLGNQLIGLTAPQRRQFALATMMRVAEHAKANGVPIEMDMTNHEGFAFTVEAARHIVKTLNVPMRIALPARFKDADGVLTEWAALARETGLKLGVRLVKGSYLEASDEGTINTHKELRAHYQQMISLAMKNSDALDVGVATQNEEVWRFAQAESKRQGGAKYAMHVIRGVNPALQEKMRAEDHIAQEYVSYGPDAPVFGVSEMVETLRQKRAMGKKLMAQVE